VYGRRRVHITGADRLTFTGELAMPSETGAANGALVLRSPWERALTVQHLLAAFASKGLTVFAHIDQQAQARSVGLDQPPMHLLLVGNPRAGTPVMLAVPQSGLDLPPESAGLGGRARRR
jgi:hypothetical protein